MDPIERQDVLSICRETIWNGADDYYPISASGIAKKVKELPSVQPERKKGRWRLLANGNAICQECKHVQKSAWDMMDGWDNFCHHCGADMRGEQDDDHK